TVTVPAGATTGPISVTTAGGSSTSSSPFTVTGTSGTPTISDFSPAIGTAGAPVTVNGTNFEVRPTDNRLRFNLMQTPIVNATPSVLSAMVPGGGTSGRLAVSTPNGQAQSSDDFFVPPPGYATEQVVFTGRLALGGATLTPSFATAGRIALVVFDGSAGEEGRRARGGGVPRGRPPLTPPAGGLRPGGGRDFNGGSPPVPPPPAPGTYPIRVPPAGTLTGSAPLTLSQDLALGVIQISG